MGAVMVGLLATDEAEGRVARASHVIATILQTDLDLAGWVGALLPLLALRRWVESLRLAVRFGGSCDVSAGVNWWQGDLSALRAHPVGAARAQRYTLGFRAAHEGVAEIDLCLARGFVLAGDLVLTVDTLRNRSRVLHGLLAVDTTELIREKVLEGPEGNLDRAPSRREVDLALKGVFEEVEYRWDTVGADGHVSDSTPGVLLSDLVLEADSALVGRGRHGWKDRVVGCVCSCGKERVCVGLI